MHAWMIKSWPTLDWHLPDDPAEWPAFWHMSTNVRDADRSGRRSGDTVWITSVEGRSVGAAWEWTEMHDGVLVLSDPNSIITNIRFVSVTDEDEPSLRATISLNRIAHTVPWQDAVRTVLRTVDEHPEVLDAPLTSFFGAPRAHARVRVAA